MEASTTVLFLRCYNIENLPLVLQSYSCGDDPRLKPEAKSQSLLTIEFINN